MQKLKVQNEVQHHLVSLSPNVTGGKNGLRRASTAKDSTENSCRADTKTKPGRVIRRARLCFHTTRSFSQHASVSQLLCLFIPCDPAAVAPSGPSCWRRILLSEAVSDRSHGGQVTELRFLSAPCQSPGRSTELIWSPTTQEVETAAKPKILLLLVCKVVWADDRDNKSLHRNKTITSCTLAWVHFSAVLLLPGALISSWARCRPKSHIAVLHFLHFQQLTLAAAFLKAFTICQKSQHTSGTEPNATYAALLP